MSGHLEWGMLTISLCVVPLILSQLISLRWHKADDTPVTLKTIVLHSCLLGIIQRSEAVFHSIENSSNVGLIYVSDTS